MQNLKLDHKIVIFFCVFILSRTTSAQLSFCQGNSGAPIFEENFGTGNSFSQLPSGTTTYNYIAGYPDDGFYSVSNGSFNNPYDWHEIEDHTPDDNNGKFLIVNAGFTPGEFYTTTINGLCESTTYEFSAWVLNFLKVPGFCIDQGIEIPINVTFQIWDESGTNLLASGDTGDVFATASPLWDEYGLVFQTLPGQTTLILKMLNNGVGGCGNDLAIDDIQFKTCGDSVVINDEFNNTSVSVCENEIPYSTTLTAIPDFSVFNSHFYQWQKSNDGTNWEDIIGETSQSINVSIDAQTYYRTKVAEFANNLINNQCVLFSENFQASVNISPDAPVGIGESIYNCNLNEANLEVQVPSGIAVNWYDSPSGGNILQVNSNVFIADQEGFYYAEAINEITGCISLNRTEVSVIIEIPDPPEFTQSGNFDCNLNNATLEVSVPNGISVNWYDSETGGNILSVNSPILSVSEIGDYYAESVNEITGCISETRTEVSALIESPNPPIVDGDTGIDCQTNEAQLIATVSSGETVNWYDEAEDGNLILANSTSLIVNQLGTYYAEAVDIVSGCASLTRVSISVLEELKTGDCIIPQGISPGVSPGLNDTFDLSGFEVDDLKIFNRYGRLVYTKRNYINEWEGQTNDGEELPVGTYYYTFVYNNGTKTKTGWVYLNR